MRERFRCPPVPRAARDGLRDRYMFLLAPKPQPDTMSYDNKGLRLPIRMKEVFGVQPDGHLLSVLRRCWCRCGLRARVSLPVGSSRANCRISAFRFGTQASQRGLRPRCVSSVFCPRLRCFDIGACSWNLGCGVHGLVAQRYEGSTPLGDAGSSIAVRGVVSFVRLCCGSRNGVFLGDALRVRIGSSTGGQRRRCSSCSRIVRRGTHRRLCPSLWNRARRSAPLGLCGGALMAAAERKRFIFEVD